MGKCGICGEPSTNAKSHCKDCGKHHAGSTCTVCSTCDRRHASNVRHCSKCNEPWTTSATHCDGCGSHHGKPHCSTASKPTRSKAPKSKPEPKPKPKPRPPKPAESKSSDPAPKRKPAPLTLRVWTWNAPDLKYSFPDALAPIRDTCDVLCLQEVTQSLRDTMLSGSGDPSTGYFAVPGWTGFVDTVSTEKINAVLVRGRRKFEVLSCFSWAGVHRIAPTETTVSSWRYPPVSAVIRVQPSSGDDPFILSVTSYHVPGNSACMKRVPEIKSMLRRTFARAKDPRGTLTDLYLHARGLVPSKHRLAGRDWTFVLCGDANADMRMNVPATGPARAGAGGPRTRAAKTSGMAFEDVVADADVRVDAHQCSEPSTPTTSNRHEVAFVSQSSRHRIDVTSKSDPDVRNALIVDVRERNKTASGSTTHIPVRYSIKLTP